MPVNAQSVLDAIGLGELVARDVLAVQLMVLAATVAAFVISLALAVVASRSARRAGRARADAETFLRSAQDIVVEARQISAHIDRATARSATVEPIAPVRVSARETTPEAAIAIDRGDAPADRALGAAAEAASVPKGLLRFRRR